MSLHCANLSVFARIPHPTALRAATIPPGEGKGVLIATGRRPLQGHLIRHGFAVPPSPQGEGLANGGTMCINRPLRGGNGRVSDPLLHGRLRRGGPSGTPVPTKEKRHIGRSLRGIVGDGLPVPQIAGIGIVGTWGFLPAFLIRPPFGRPPSPRGKARGRPSQ